VVSCLPLHPFKINNPFQNLDSKFSQKNCFQGQFCVSLWGIKHTLPILDV
jgi:hypothetical protein